jgi:hypothetical protein
MIKQDVLNAGYVRLVEYMGGDESVKGAGGQRISRANGRTGTLFGVYFERDT